MSDDEFIPSGSHSVSLSPGVAWGVVATVLGCALLLSACVLMVFNVLLWSNGLAGIPLDWARLGGALGVGGVAILGVFAIVSGVKGWNAALSRGETTAFGVAGTITGTVGFIAWAIAGIDLLAILFG